MSRKKGVWNPYDDTPVSLKSDKLGPEQFGRSLKKPSDTRSSIYQTCMPNFAVSIGQRWGNLFLSNAILKLTKPFASQTKFSHANQLPWFRV